jgi:hypothetical protein
MGLILWQGIGDLPLRAQDPVAVAEAEAKASAETQEGRKFAERVGVSFGGEHGSTISRCAKEIKRPDLTNFSLYLRVASTGSVEEVLVKPGTDLGECVRAKLKGWKAGVPPAEGTWVQVAVHLKAK